MNEALKTLEAHSIAAMELLDILENGGVDVSEKLSKMYAFAGLTAETIAALGGPDEVQDRVRELESALADAQGLLSEREGDCTAAIERAKTAETQVLSLKAEISGLDQAYAKQLAELEKTNSDLEEELARTSDDVGVPEDVPTGVISAHKRLAEGMRLYDEGDYETAIRKLVLAEKTLRKIDGKEFAHE